MENNHKTIGNTLASAMRREAGFFAGSDTHALLTQGANMLETFEHMANDNISELILLRAERREHKEYWREVLTLLSDPDATSIELIKSIANQALDLS